MNAFALTTLLECIDIHVHGFYTCAEIGVTPDLEAFTRNVIETLCEERFFHAPTDTQARNYIEAHWPDIEHAMMHTG